MDLNKKILLIFPPIATPVSPYLSMPLLAGQLKQAGYKVTNLDLSLEFFNYILNSNYLRQCYEKARKIYENLKVEIGAKSTNDDQFKQYQFSLRKKIYTKEYYEKEFIKEEYSLYVINNIDSFVSSYRNKDIFYNPEKMKEIHKHIEYAFSLVMYSFYPSILTFCKYKNPFYLNIPKHIYSQIKEESVFTNFYKEIMKSHNLLNYDLICFSSPNSAQIIPMLELARMIKEQSNVKIAIGGNIISRIDNILLKMPTLFTLCTDYIIAGCGETSIVKLADYILGKNKNISKVKGLIYKENGIIKHNKPDYSYNINKSSNMCLDGLNLDKYFSPEIIMPVQSSKGCYWGKCVFCGLHCPPKKYTVKNVSSVVDELEFLNKQYKIKYFEFIDESVSPKYLSKLADEILKRGLEIKYACCCRLETNGYTIDLCKKLYNSGLSLVEFGYETASKRIFNLINKGEKIEGRNDIIKMFSSVGIYTYIYAILGYPSETVEEAQNTISIREQNQEIIDNVFIHKFFLDKQSPAFKHYKKLGIIEVINDKNDIFLQECRFKTQNEIMYKEVDDLYIHDMEKSIFSKYNFFLSDEHLFLYAMHFGRYKIKEVLTDFYHNDKVKC